MLWPWKKLSFLSTKMNMPHQGKGYRNIYWINSYKNSLKRIYIFNLFFLQILFKYTVYNVKDALELYNLIIFLSFWPCLIVKIKYMENKFWPSPIVCKRKGTIFAEWFHSCRRLHDENNERMLLVKF